MTTSHVLLLALLIGILSGLRALSPIAVTAWGAYLGWFSLPRPYSLIGTIAGVAILSLAAIGELVNDKLPKTPPRTALPSVVIRCLLGAFAGACIAIAGMQARAGAGAGIVGALIGTFGGYQVRMRLVKVLGRRIFPSPSSKILSRFSARCGWPAGSSCATGKRSLTSIFPFGRPSMSPSKHYDAIVIGSGQGGTPLCQALADAGMRTALVEREHIGGTCINEGCTPTKTIIASGRVGISHAARVGLRSEERRPTHCNGTYPKKEARYCEKVSHG